VIDLIEEQVKNANDLMPDNSESVSKKTEESDLQLEKHSEQRI
jgi:hypothetical protein